MHGAFRWDFLIVTAANSAQAEAYRVQLQLRRSAGQLDGFGEVLTIADLDGRRIGSGGSTIQCLLEIANRAAAPASLRGLRVLIVHAGGDSRRLPAYSPCGKIFVPLPTTANPALPVTLFDRLVSIFRELSPAAVESGQVVVASGDALLLFDPATADLSRRGITALATCATPEEASRHGVLCPNPDGSTRLYLQKPSIAEQRAQGAIGAQRRTALDVGVMSFDGDAVAALLDIFCETATPSRLAWRPRLLELVFAHGLDLYREICCAMGTDSTFEHYLGAARGSGSKWPESALAAIYPSLHAIPLPVEVLEECEFLHFGSTGQLISSGLTLVGRDTGAPPRNTVLTLTSAAGPTGIVSGTNSWIEACHVCAPLSLGGRNVVTGVDVVEPLALPPGACLDLSQGVGRRGEAVWFVRCYGIGDTFKHAVDAGATFCGMLLSEWLDRVGAAASDIWDDTVPARERTLWNARVFPAEKNHACYWNWLWMFDVSRSTPDQRMAFLKADRYSAADIALLVDQDAFHAWRHGIHRAGLHSRAATAAVERESE